MPDDSLPKLQRYFYCCSLPLGVGSVIGPGNWGRVIHAYTPQSSPNAWLLVRELVYENIRIRNYPQKPSRFDSLFLCMTESDLNDFRVTCNRRLDLGYEVELVDPTAPCHVGDWTLPNMQNTDDLRVFVNRAMLYWQGNDIVKQELVTLSSIRIMKALS